ncbi:MAG TPA: hypothetical protein O0X27_02565 [Methanocorpusculum sp.]|nr:hypothetical protein [Methanocorpusculum sp.]
MKLLSSLQHKACADGSYMKEYQISEPLTEEFFRYLQQFGTVEQVSKLDDGYYTFSRKNWFSIKGLVGDNRVEVRFNPATMDVTTDFLRMLFAKFGPDPDIAYLRKCMAIRDAEIERILKH